MIGRLILALAVTALMVFAAYKAAEWSLADFSDDWTWGD